MKIPKYIDTAIENRVKAIAIYWRNDEIVRAWCNKNGVETEYLGSYVDCFADPVSAEQELRKDIENAEEVKWK